MIEEPGTVTVRAGDELDRDALQAWLRDHVDVPGGPLSIRQFSAGHANLTYLVGLGDTRIVVRRPPKGTIAPGAHDMAREWKVLSRLGEAYPRAPRALGFCDDESVIGAPFVVMEYVGGDVVTNAVPPSMADLPDVVRRLDLALVDAAADLHAVDVEAVGLGDLGKPDGFARRQVAGWTDRWHRAAPATPVPMMDEVASRLEAGLPTPVKVAIVHNDLKIDNCVFAPGDPDVVTGVVDWDMATLGDPLFDLGLLVTSMGAGSLWTLTPEDVLARWSERSGIGVDGFGWYLAFATWRTGVVLQQLANRWSAGDSTDERLAAFADLVPQLARRALDLLEDGS